MSARPVTSLKSPSPPHKYTPDLTAAWRFQATIVPQLPVHRVRGSFVHSKGNPMGPCKCIPVLEQRRSQFLHVAIQGFAECGISSKPGIPPRTTTLSPGYTVHWSNRIPYTLQVYINHSAFPFCVIDPNGQSQGIHLKGVGCCDKRRMQDETETPDQDLSTTERGRYAYGSCRIAQQGPDSSLRIQAAFTRGMSRASLEPISKLLTVYSGSGTELVWLG